MILNNSFSHTIANIMSTVSKSNSRVNHTSKKPVSVAASHNKTSKPEGSTGSRIKQNPPPVECSICSKRHVDPKLPISLGCGHKICSICCELVGPTESKLRKKKCPECAAPQTKVEKSALKLDISHAGSGENPIPSNLDKEQPAGGAVWDEASPSSSDIDPDEMSGKPHQPQSDPSNPSAPQDPQPSERSVDCPSSDSHEVCGTHGQPFTGFCMSCRTLTCVDCLYAGHKAHDFHPLPRARRLAADALARAKILAEGVREQVANRLTRVRSQVSEADDLEASKLAEMKSIMNQLKRQIMLREKKLEEAIRLEFQNYKQKAQADLGLAQKELVRIDTAVSGAKHLEILDDTRFLGN